MRHAEKWSIPTWFFGCLAALVLITVPAMARPKADIVYFKNGDRWICEITKLDRAYLYVKLDYVDGTVSVDWSKVDRIDSSQLFVVRDDRGTLYVGSLQTSPDGTPQPPLIVGVGPQAHTLPWSRIVTIDQTENSFWRGLHGSLDSGLNYSKSDSQTQYTLNAQTNYVKEFWWTQATFQSSFTDSQSSDAKLREDLTLVATRMLKPRSYFGAVIATFQKNDEQQLDWRTVAGGGLGHFVRDTGSNRIYWLAGGDWTRERYNTGADPVSTVHGAEAFAGFSMEHFRFKTANYQITLFAYPSLTDPGRVRMDGNASMKFEIVKNLYLSFSTYVNYDSKPPRSTTKSDFGGSSSLGWTF